MGDDCLAEPAYAVNSEQELHPYDEERLGEEAFSEHRYDPLDSLEDGSAGNHRDSSSSGKLFVGGIAWETTEETFNSYFCQYGEITDSIIMMDKHSGRPRGFGFVTFTDPMVAGRVLEEEHVIDGRVVEVKRTVPRGAMLVKGESRTKKIFVGGIPLYLTEDDLKEYFSSYGNVVEYQIMLDRNTGRSRGFGFVTFDSENAVERILSDGQMHELGGKQVEIKRAEPKRGGGDYVSDSRPRHGGISSKSYGGFGGTAAGFGSGYGRKMGLGNGGYGIYDGFGIYGNYEGTYGGASAGFYAAGYGPYGYGFGYGGLMYNGVAYMGYDTLGSFGAAAGYSAVKGRGSSVDVKGYNGIGGSYGGNKGNGSGSASGRYNPYRK